MKLLVEYKGKKGYLINTRFGVYGGTICDVVLSENGYMKILDVPVDELIVIDEEYTKDEKLK